MRRVKQLLGGRVTVTSDGAPTSDTSDTSDNSPLARGFLTIGGTTYVDPHGSYPLAHCLDGSATLIVNDTDRYITVITERSREQGCGLGGELVLAPGERAETWRGDSVRVG